MKKILKIYIGVFVLTIVYCLGAQAQEITLQEGQECGTNCVYTYDSENKHWLKTGSDCDGKCTYYYDTATQNMTIKPNNGVSGDLNIKNSYKDYNLGPVKDFIIEEGITAVDHWGQSRFPLIGTGTLYLPSTLQAMGANSSLFSSFTTIDSKSGYNPFSCFRCMNSSKLTTLILNPVDGVVFGSGWRENSKGLNVLCRGAVSMCQTMVQANSYEYYVETDSDGNTIKYNDRGYVKYDPSGNIIGEYDLKNKLLVQYLYNSDGSLAIYDNKGKLIGLKGKKIFTVEEATALVRNGKNTFKLKYR